MYVPLVLWHLVKMPSHAHWKCPSNYHRFKRQYYIYIGCLLTMYLWWPLLKGAIRCTLALSIQWPLLQKAIRCPLAMSLQWPLLKKAIRCPLAMSLQWPLLKRPSDVHWQCPSNGHLMVSGPLIPIRWVYFHYGVVEGHNGGDPLTKFNPILRGRLARYPIVRTWRG